MGDVDEMFGSSVQGGWWEQCELHD